MLTVEKWVDEVRDDGVSHFTFKRDENKILKIMFGGNLDLYFALDYKGEDKTFMIGKDNMAIYEIFDRLYHNVITGNVFLYDDDFELNKILLDSELFDEDYHEGIRKYEERKEKDKIYYSNRARSLELVQNDEIIWRSDDFEVSVAPYFKITKLENAYLLTFDIPKNTRKLETLEESELGYMRHAQSISVRLRNSGSRYDYFSGPFMMAFRALHELDIENPQIHIEEYLIESQINQGETLERILRK